MPIKVDGSQETDEGRETRANIVARYQNCLRKTILCKKRKEFKKKILVQTLRNICRNARKKKKKKNTLCLLYLNRCYFYLKLLPKLLIITFLSAIFPANSRNVKFFFLYFKCIFLLLITIKIKCVLYFLKERHVFIPCYKIFVYIILLLFLDSNLNAHIYGGTIIHWINV